jgi:signal transduction histidine kinase
MTEAERTKLNESLGRLAAAMAHDFNNVLMCALQAGEMIGRFYPDEPRLTRIADQLFDAVSRGRRITSDVLRFSHPPDPAVKTFEILKWLACRIPEVESLVARRGVGLHFEVPQAEVTASGDSELLRQALMHLVTNACDAMPLGGDLTVALSSGEEHVQLRVSDTGSGMPPKTLEHIFEPLFTTKPHHTGLGLAVAHQGITASGGTIDVESQPGVGTTFTIRLPRANVSSRAKES